MYVKLFHKILESSLADDRKLRHFFTDLLLCADPDGVVNMTEAAIARKINATPEEVRDGLEKLKKEDPSSFHTENGGRRIIPLEGHGYGWKIVNFIEYHGLRDANALRQATAERVARHRAKKKEEKDREERMEEIGEPPE